jgi:imidazolonepropionase-like amidohydrolase
MVHAIKARRRIDGHGSDPIKNAIVLIEGKNMFEAGSSAMVKMPKEVKITDASDNTIIPGLVDTHVHVMASSASLVWRAPSKRCESPRSTPPPLVSTNINLCSRRFICRFPVCSNQTLPG